jgi:hypothetical protein
VISEKSGVNKIKNLNMKIFTFISTFVLSLLFVNAQAAKGYKCLKFSGDIPTAIPDGVPGQDLGLYYNADACAIVAAAQDKYFPDMELQVPYCFTTKFEGNLGSTPVIVTANSGIIKNYNTVNGFDFFNGVPDMTAASVFNFRKRNKDGTVGRNIGEIYSRDMTIDLPYANDGSNPREYLIITNGNALFNQALGSIVIEGDVALGAPANGKICIHSNRI